MAEPQRPLPTRRELRHRKKRATIAWATVTAVAIVTAASAASIPTAYAAADASASFTGPSASTADDSTLDTIVGDAHAALAEADAVKVDAATLVLEISQAGLDLGVEDTRIDVAPLQESAERLDAVDLAAPMAGSVMALPLLTDEVEKDVRLLSARTADLRERLDTAVAEKAAADAAAAAEAAAAAAAAEAQRQAEEAAAALAAANTPEGAKATARELAASTYGWGDDEFSCLASLWEKESNWNYLAMNPSSGATGIAQALPGDKMATVADDWASSARTQIIWGLEYIAATYGSPCSAWGNSQATNWY